MNYIKKLTLFSIFISTFISLSHAECLSRDSQIRKIKQSINNLVVCWNRSDVDCALGHYYGNDAIYISKTGPIFGKNDIINYFTHMLSDKKTGKINLGELKLNVLFCKKIDSTHILTLQEYHFKENDSAPLREGYDTLIWEKINQDWFIIYDQPRDK